VGKDAVRRTIAKMGKNAITAKWIDTHEATQTTQTTGLALWRAMFGDMAGIRSSPRRPRLKVFVPFCLQPLQTWRVSRSTCVIRTASCGVRDPSLISVVLTSVQPHTLLTPRMWSSLAETQTMV
jgi:hypothetical protein